MPAAVVQAAAMDRCTGGLAGAYIFLPWRPAREKCSPPPLADGLTHTHRLAQAKQAGTSYASTLPAAWQRRWPASWTSGIRRRHLTSWKAVWRPGSSWWPSHNLCQIDQIKACLGNPSTENPGLKRSESGPGALGESKRHPSSSAHRDQF